MKKTRIIMGMHITILIEDAGVSAKIFQDVFNYFQTIDDIFSPYKATSEVTQINRGELREHKYSDAMREIIALSEQTKKETHGYFDSRYKNHFDPSGIVKGWAIQHAAKIISTAGGENFSIDAGGDIHVSGKNTDKREWKIGIRNPFNHSEIVKIVRATNKGIATSGTYIRGAHIYNPHDAKFENPLVSFTVIGPTVYDADRFATAAFAMGRKGINFIDELEGYEGYMIDKYGVATMTRGFECYVTTD